MTAAALAWGGATTPARADSSVPLSSYYAHMVVDDAHDHVYMIGGQSSEVISVTDLDGSHVGGIPGQFGASGMVLSPDGSTLYVAQSQGEAISAIDTTTLQQTAVYRTGSGIDPENVVWAGGRLWFSYTGQDGASRDGGLGSVDLSGDTPAVNVEPSAWTYFAPNLAAAPGNPDQVVTAANDGNPEPLETFDVSSGTPTEVALNTAWGANGRAFDMAVTPDGRDVAIAGGTPYAVRLFRVSDLTADGTYPMTDYPSAVAIAPDGTVAAGSNYTATVGLAIFTPGVPTPLRTFTTPVVAQGLAWSQDSSRLYELTGGTNMTLHIYDAPQQRPTTMTLDVPSDGVAGVPLTVSGHLTSDAPFAAGTTVHVTRTDAAQPSGKALPDASVAADGNFSFTDTPTSAGDTSYQVSYGGDPQHAPVTKSGSTSLAEADTTMTLRAPDTGTSGSQLELTGTLTSSVPFADGQTVHVTRDDPSGSVDLPDASVAADGGFTIDDTPPVAGSVTYTVGYPGDVSHKAAPPRSATVAVSRAVPTLTVTTDTSSYPYGATATVTAQLSTPAGATVSLYAQPFGGAKKLIGTGAVDDDGYLTAAFRVTRATTFTAEFAGDDTYAPVTASYDVTAQARVTDRAQGSATTTTVDGRTYYVYRHGAGPTESAAVAPSKQHECVVFTTQQWSGTAWQTVSSSGCVRTDASSTALHQPALARPSGARFRFRAQYRHSGADPANLDTRGGWVYFQLRG